MKIFAVVSLLMTSSIAFAGSFRQHVCTPVNPAETGLASLEIIGHLPADLSHMNVTYSARVKSFRQSGAPLQFERSVAIAPGGKIDAPLVYEGQAFKLDIEYYPAPGGDGRQHLGTVQLTDNELNSISAQVVCRTSLIN